MRVIAPLGVLLPPGVSLRIDDAGRRPSELPAVPRQRLRRPARHGRQAHRQAEDRQDRDARHLPDARAGRRRARRRWPASRKPTSNCHDGASVVSTACSSTNPDRSMSKSAAMTVRATSFRIALFRRRSALAGCGLSGSVGSSVESFLPHRDPNADSLNSGANPRQVAGKPASQSEREAEGSAGRFAGHQLPEVDIAEGGAALRVGGPDNASVRYQFNIGDTARECDPAGPGQATLKIGVSGRRGDRTGRLGRDLQRAAEDHRHAATATRRTVFSKTYKVEATTDGVTAGAIPRRDRSDLAADADAPARRRLFDHRRLRGRDGGPPPARHNGRKTSG